ncbi:MAG: calcium-binding protein [Xenococcaceae cyanobacterium MO_188.B19]|nr:calcium-binding protein [Xenococcaceae cyanobacterium MO_188.B19]
MVASINLADLDGTNGFVINGIDSGDLSGFSVSNAGDVNGDGFDDLIIGAYLADPNGNGNAGESYVVFGGADVGQSGSLELSALDGTNGFVINGIDSGDLSGRSVTNAGDINDDGIDDFIIAAQGADPNGNGNAGESYVVFGGADVGQSGSLELSALDGTNGFVINGIDSGDSDRSNTSVSNAGDINNDGIDDLIIGAFRADPNGNGNAGESYVVFGGANVGQSGSLELSALDGTNGFVINGVDSFDLSGFSVSNAGDINDDGIDDLIIGAIAADPNGKDRAGESYVVFGGANVGQSGSLELSALDGTNGFVINGIDVSDDSGVVVSNAGDINGDGIDDLIIGANDGDPNGNSNAGETYVVFGGANVGQSGSLELSALDGTNGFVIKGIDSSDYSGDSVSNAGDINGDGIDDLIIGALFADPNGEDTAGESYVVFGGANVGQSGSLELSTLDGTNGLVINGIDSSDQSGRSVSSAGDVNGDGIDDLIIGANGGQPNGNFRAGESYVIFGFKPEENPEIKGTANNDFLSGTSEAETISGLGGNDSLKGLAGDDTLLGGNGQDTLRGNAGDDVLEGEQGFDLLFGDLGNDTLSGGLGSDTLRGGANDDLLQGNSGFDLLLGNNGNDILVGGNGNDKLRGDGGNDRLDGGLGNDNLFGGAGADVFVLKPGAGNDLITDYVDGIDRFVLGGGLEFNDLTIVQNINNTQIQITGTNEVLATLNSVTANFLNTDDFMVES